MAAKRKKKLDPRKKRTTPKRKARAARRTADPSPAPAPVAAPAAASGTSPPTASLAPTTAPPAPDFDLLDDAGDLTPRQRRFVIAYLADPELNQKRAAIAAGYAPGCAEVTASRLLSLAKVDAVVKLEQQARARRLRLQADDVLRILLCIANADLRRVTDEHGRILHIHDIPADLAQAVSSIETEELFETIQTEGPRGGMRSQRIHAGFVRKVKVFDKNKALELLGKHLKLYTEVMEDRSPGKNLSDEDLASAVQAVFARARAREAAEAAAEAQREPATEEGGS